MGLIDMNRLLQYLSLHSCMAASSLSLSQLRPKSQISLPQTEPHLKPSMLTGSTSC